jgi:hypothetical protein
MHEVVAAQSGRSFFEKILGTRAAQLTACVDRRIQSVFISVFIVPRCHLSELERREQKPGAGANESR